MSENNESTSLLEGDTHSLPLEDNHKSSTSLMQAIKFTLFSISAGVIQLGSYTLFMEVLGPAIFGREMTHWECYLPSLLLSVIWNFTFNRKYTFQSATNVPIAMAKVLGYYAVFTPVSLFLGHWATKHFRIADGSLANYVVEGVTMLVNFVTEFLFDKYVVFTDKKEE